MTSIETALNYDRFGRDIKNRSNHIKPKTKPRSEVDEQSMSKKLDHLFNGLRFVDPTEPETRSKCSAWKSALESNGPYQYMFTLSFKHRYSDAEGISALSQWATRTNREVYGPRWKRKGIGFSGFSVAERHNLSWDFRGRLHFHTLISQSDTLLDFERLEDVAYRKALLLKDCNGRPMTDMFRIDFRPVVDESRLIGYLLKNAEVNGWPIGDGIAFWKSGERIQGFQFQPLSARQLTKLH